MELRVRSEAKKLLAAAHRDGCFWRYCCVKNWRELEEEALCDQITSCFLTL